MKIKLLTYNIQHGLDYKLIKYDHIRHINLDQIAEIITASEADIIGLNEVYNSSIKNPDRVEQVAKLAQYTEIPYHVFAKALSVGGVDDFGNGLISKYEPTNIEIFNVYSPKIRRENAYYEDRALLKVDFLIEGKPLTVFVTHFGLAKAEQKDMFDCFVEQASKLDHPYVFMGDFNQEDDSPYIEELKKLMNITIEEPVPTYPSINPYRRIDYIFVSKDLKFEEPFVYDFVASDHRAVTVTIDL